MAAKKKAVKKKTRSDNLSREDRKLAAGLAESLINGFNWDHTKEGFAYWNSIHDRLNELSTPVACEHCGLRAPA